MAMPNPEALVVLVTAPVEASRTLAEALVERRLCACVNILPAVQSVYRWQGEVQVDSEALLVIKTTAERFPQLQNAVLELHPYELPEIIGLSIAAGLPAYLEWVVNSVQEPLA